MSIETIINQREALLQAIDKGLASAKPKADVLSRPIEQQQDYINALTTRIDSLETLRKQQNERIDSDVEALKADLKSANDRMEADRKILAPVTDKPATPPKRTATGPAKPKGPSTPA